MSGRWYPISWGLRRILTSRSKHFSERRRLAAKIRLTKKRKLKLMKTLRNRREKLKKSSVNAQVVLKDLKLVSRKPHLRKQHLFSFSNRMSDWRYSRGVKGQAREAQHQQQVQQQDQQQDQQQVQKMKLPQIKAALVRVYQGEWEETTEGPAVAEGQDRSHNEKSSHF